MYSTSQYEILLYLILINCSLALNFNYDTEHAIIFKPHVSHNDVHHDTDYQAFGSSVAMIKLNKTTRIIVGAPKGKSRLIKTHQTGLAYSCKINQDGMTTSCKEIRLSTRYLGKSFKTKHLFTSGMNLGLNIAVGGSNNLLTICGHLHNLANQPSGICFLVSPLNMDIIKVLLPKSKKLSGSNQQKLMGKAVHEMFGFSSAFTRTSNQLIFGAPGYDIFRGAIYTASNINKMSPTANISINTINEIDQDSYFGYSVTTGIFFKSQSELAVVGAPRSHELIGQVYIVEINQNDLNGNVIQIIEGHQFGEYFGCSILSIDLNNNGYDDLLVGAPLYMPEHNPKGDCGRVYIYSSNGDHLVQSAIIEGDSIFGSRFGSSLAYIGDLDGDSFNDFAVGAPQENEGSGSVYIYSARLIKTSKKYLQKIDSSKSFDLLGFGSSIYSGIDVDNDNCPDLLVGSYMSDAAVLLKCRRNQKLIHTT